MRATIITDASFCPKTKAAGWAAWIASDLGPRVRKAGGFKERPNTSTIAEVWAAYNGMFIAYKLGARRLLIQSDCVAVATAINKPNGKYGFAEMIDRMPGATFEYRHVKGHTRNPASRSWVNRWCDKHAKYHMELQRSKGKKP